ncbi:MAG: redoxin domain-containing protein [Elusimicrobia bacterium]|nr:redoxin domain-containing protein [Elusimicrobiota bacterium]
MLSANILFFTGLLLLLPVNCLKAGFNAGDRSPDFELPDLSGRMISLSDILREDKPVVLSFFGTWCDSCLKEMTDLAELAPKYNAAVYLVGVDADKGKLERFAAKHKIQFPILWDPKAKTIGKKYDLFRGAFVIVPKTFIISPAGSIEYSAESYDEKRKAALTEKFARLAGKKWQKPDEVAVFFTGSANGYLESCNCYKHPYGGFIKLVSLLRQQILKYSNHILVDSGDFLPYGVNAPQAGPIFKAMSLAGYDAVAVGDQDLRYGGFINEVKKGGLPFLASNVRIKGGMPGLGDKTIIAGNLKIRIVSFTSSETFSLYPEEFTAKLEFKDLKEVLKDGEKADFLILLSHAGLDENKKIAAEFGQIDLIIAGHSQELLKSPVKAGNALIVQSGGNLQNLGRLILRFDGGKPVDHSYEVFPLTNDIPNSPQVEAILQESKKAIR